MSDNDQRRSVVDEYGNIHYLTEELARGGQGVVFRTEDPDLAIKQPLENGCPDTNVNVTDVFSRVRTLPLPRGVPISLPLAILRNEPGYVMKLLNGMKSFESFSLDGAMRQKIADEAPPEWLAGVSDRKLAQDLFYYSKTGSTRRRLYALYKCAAVLARIHNAGIVYCDISDKNVFIGDDIPGDCWLIDADNLRLELPNGGKSVYTRFFGAPEIVQGKDASRPRTDCWAFAVLAFQTLALCHPFIGKKVMDSNVGWDAEPPADGMPSDLDEQAYAGYLPFIDDDEDDSNELPGGGLPRMLVLTPKLRKLFQETFGIGRTAPHRRPSMMFWARELSIAFDHSIVCPGCGMSYFDGPDFAHCPYCQLKQPAYVIAKTNRGQMYLPISGNGVFEVRLPRRLFHPFSPIDGDACEYEAEIDPARKMVLPVRGTKPFPDGLEFEFANSDRLELANAEGSK